METLARAANRGSISTGGYEIDNSLKLERANSENLYRQIINGNRKTWTTSLWIKRTNVSASAYQMIINHGIYGNGTYLRFLTDDTLQTGIEHNGGIVNQTTSQVFRDTSAWMHIVWRVDTTQATGADRSRLYINGEQVTSFSQDQTITQNTDTFCNYDHSGYDDEQFGYKEASLFTSMYYADIYHVDGQSLAPTEFGEVDSASGIWKPIEADISSFGNNGYYLNFSNSSNLGEDTAGNGSFTLSNITAADQSTDTPTNNFATLNPLIIHGANDYFVITEGGTNIIQSGQVGWGTMTANIAVNSGKWYAEIKSASSLIMIGNSQVDDPVTYSVAHLGQLANTTSLGMGYYNSNGDIYRNAGNTGYGDAWDSGDIMGIALEFKSDGTANMYVAENNVWKNSADPAAGTGGAALDYGNALPTGLHFTFAVALHNNTGETEVNFGGFTTISIASAATDANGYGTFEHAPPSGYYALCTKNLAEYG
jgi:hypothetical protein